jgi:uroporphyrinogen decarboxylase
MSTAGNGREIVTLLNNGGIPPRVPFVPVIYEHAASLLGVTPSVLAQDGDLIVKGQLTAYELYKQDLVSVGVDIYNVEAEALGCEVKYFDDLSIPSVSGPIVMDLEDLKRLRVPDPATDGRMPMFVSATKRIHEALGNEVFVSGTIVGPFTLAAILRGFDNLLMDFFMDEGFALEQLRFASEVGFAYAKAFIDAGTGISINESWIAPPLLSPDLFETKVFEFEKQLISRIKSSGLKNVALICGGNTSPIADLLAQTGTSLLMADANSDQAAYKKLCEAHKINLRASIDSVLLQKGDEYQLEEAVKNVIAKCSANGRFILGCGVVSADTPPGNVLKLKALVDKYNPYD